MSGRLRQPGRLTVREWEILQLAGEGLGYKQIAQRLGIAPTTVRQQASNAYRHLGVRSLQAALAVCGPEHAPQQRRRLEPEPAVTPAQKLYLQAFDRHLKAWAAGDEQGETRTRQEMRWMLGAVYIEAGRQLPGESAERQRDASPQVERAAA